MSLLDYIAMNNRRTDDNKNAFVCEGKQIGIIHDDITHIMASMTDDFIVQEGFVHFALEHQDHQTRSGAINRLEDRLIKEGLFSRHNELFAVKTDWQATPLFEADRSLIALLGMIGYAIHVNGYCYKDDTLHVWIGTRSKTVNKWPGRLDQMVAGGQPKDISLRDNMIKESGEEAGLSPDIAQRAKNTGFVSAYSEGDGRVYRSMLYIYDLALTLGEQPTPDIVEVEKFELLSATKVLEILENDKDAFKPICAMVMIDFFIRHGIITPDYPDYNMLVMGVRGFSDIN